jgi:hypothetical protein
MITENYHNIKMNNRQKIRFLNKANDEFHKLSKKTKYKANMYKTIDFAIKIILALGGALITYFSDDIKNNQNFDIAIKTLGIIISGLTALTSVFMFEKRSLSNMQVYAKCQSIIPEIEDKIDILNQNINTDENLQDYIRKIFKDLSILNIASFTDAVFEKIASQRLLE